MKILIKLIDADLEEGVTGGATGRYYWGGSYPGFSAPRAPKSGCGGERILERAVYNDKTWYGGAGSSECGAKTGSVGGYGISLPK